MVEASFAVGADKVGTGVAESVKVKIRGSDGRGGICWWGMEGLSGDRTGDSATVVASLGERCKVWEPQCIEVGKGVGDAGAESRSVS